MGVVMLLITYLRKYVFPAKQKTQTLKVFKFITKKNKLKLFGKPYFLKF